jgi:hypothetical protein
MALAWSENIEAFSRPQRSGDGIHKTAIQGSSEQRSYLLDDTIHVVGLWKFMNPEEAITVVASLHSYALDGAALDPWSILDSRQHQDHSPTGGVYTQTFVRPEVGVGRIGMSWLRVPECETGTALFAAPNSLPRTMQLVPADLPKQAGYLTIVK